MIKRYLAGAALAVLAAGGASAETRLVLLGTAGGPTWYGPDAPHGISSALVVDGHAYIVDFGSGAFRQMRAAGIKPGDAKALFVTHLHSDHVIDLPALLTYDPSARRRSAEKIEIVGPGPRGELPPVAGSAPADMVIDHDDPVGGTESLVGQMVDALSTDMNVRVRHEGIPDVRAFFTARDIALPDGLEIDPNSGDWPEMEPFEVFRDDRVTVTATLVQHGLVFPNYAYRFDTADGSVVFSGDTAVSANLVRMARDADILVHEAIDPSWIAKIVGPEPWDARQQALADQLQNTHVTPAQAGEVATQAGVETLVLSHLVPGDAPRDHWLGAAETFAGKLVVGEDLQEITLGGD